MPYLIDSDVLIDISRGKPAAREYVDALPEGWAISQVSALELIVGARDKKRPRRHRYVFISKRDRAASGLKWHKGVQTPKAVREVARPTRLRCARCSHLDGKGLTLVTKNRKHFGISR